MALPPEWWLKKTGALALSYRNSGSFWSGLFILPFWYIKLTVTHYKKNIAAELETALSIITAAYLRNEDIVTAVEENMQYLNPRRAMYLPGF